MHQLQLKDTDLTKVKEELVYALEQIQSHLTSLDDTFHEGKKDVRFLGDRGSLPSHSSPWVALEHVPRSRDNRHPPFLDNTLHEEKRDVRLLGATQRNLTSQPSPQVTPEQASHFRDSRHPPDQVRETTTQQACTITSNYSAYSPSDRDLDKIACNITRFEPQLGGSHHTSTYLKDIDFYLQKFSNATVDDRIYLIAVTSSSDVSSFIERQPDYIR